MMNGAQLTRLSIQRAYPRCFTECPACRGDAQERARCPWCIGTAKVTGPTAKEIRHRQELALELEAKAVEHADALEGTHAPAAA